MLSTAGGDENLIAKYSKSVVDALPRIFRGLHAEANLAAADQLAHKLDHHTLLLRCLQDAGALAQLDAATLRSVLGDGQRCAGLRALLDVVEAKPSPALRAAVTAAGDLCLQAQGSQDRAPEEAFFAVPSLAPGAFMKMVAATAPTFAAEAAAKRLEATMALARGVLALLEGGSRHRAQQGEHFSTALNQSSAGVPAAEWTDDEPARAALQAVVDALVRVLEPLAREAPDAISSWVETLFAVTERLLNAYAAAMAVEPSVALALQGSYAVARDTALSALLDYALQHASADEAEGILLQVESEAESHYGFALLFRIQEESGGKERLFEHMRMLPGDARTGAGGMPAYVFDRLLREDRRSELLGLAPEFNAKLAAWLREAPGIEPVLLLELRWLQDLRMEDYSAAQNSLAALREATPSAPHSSRLLALQKLATMAASPDWPIAGGELFADMAA